MRLEIDLRCILFQLIILCMTALIFMAVPLLGPKQLCSILIFWGVISCIINPDYFCCYYILPEITFWISERQYLTILTTRNTTFPIWILCLLPPGQFNLFQRLNQNTAGEKRYLDGVHTVHRFRVYYLLMVSFWIIK